ncbi:hypothetical protein KCM76_02005 [Zooshikella marina]|uniref:hypothetical protein n=1 Tax=Zooshikella ganghwensis TaxID=202772 RepID=UPI001BB02881|nr:hypothetical protein [Zooshikella ganghwensis]MBU2704734.1 hypothetical protein [Zooshikella ganghwensis]
MNLAEIALKRSKVLNDPTGKVHLYIRPYYANEYDIRSQPSALLESIIALDFDTKTSSNNWFKIPLESAIKIMSTALSSGFMFNSAQAFLEIEANVIAKDFLALFSKPQIYTNFKYEIDSSGNMLRSSGYSFCSNLEMGFFALDREKLGAFWVFDID